MPRSIFSGLLMSLLCLAVAAAQRVGIVPDVFVEPTTAGTVVGRS